MAHTKLKFEYDRDVDAAYLTLGKGKVIDSEEVNPGIVVDFGAGDRILGVEILRFTKRFASQFKSAQASRSRLLKRSA